MSNTARPSRSGLLRFAFALAIPLSGLTLSACESPGAGSVPVYADQFLPDASPGSVDPLVQAREDSIAAWNERFASRVARPEAIRGLYVNAWAAGSRSRMAHLIRIAEETEINAFVIDIKESDTYLTHDSTGIALAKEIGADTRPASTWLPALLDTLQARGIYSIARIVVFKDRMLAEKRPELAIMHTNGGVWGDQHGKPWVNPYHREVWDYNIDIAREALDMGFSEVQWDYVRFPDVRNELQRTMAFPGAEGVSREDNIRNFIEYSRARLAEYRVPITADVFGLATHLPGDVGIGQQWEKLSEVTDALLPMVYPSHYSPGNYGIGQPNARPYEIVRISMQEAVERNRIMERDGRSVAEIVPWLQAMSATWLDDISYGPTHLREQIQATYDAGLDSWVLWNPGSRYDAFLPALRGADDSASELERSGWTATRWDPPAHRMSRVIAQREAADRAAAEAAAAEEEAAALAGREGPDEAGTRATGSEPR
jgi:hypothetical protein